MTQKLENLLSLFFWNLIFHQPKLDQQMTNILITQLMKVKKLMKEVYEALRASPQWNETLFIITYDEHGGFYDHYPPPMNVPNPDGINDTSLNFSFNRIGIRIPTILISPWLNK